MGRTNNDASLTEPDRSNQIYNTTTIARIVRAKQHLSFWSQRREVFEFWSFDSFGRIHVVDFEHLQKCKESFVLFWRPNLSFNNISIRKTKFPDLTG